MQALLIIDAQNEFSSKGNRTVSDFYSVVERIKELLVETRRENRPVAWVRHFNKPRESKAFVPKTWGAEFIQGFGPLEGSVLEKEFQKNVYGAFTGSDIGIWLKEMTVQEVLITGFYTHGCVSTTAREAIMNDLKVILDPRGTATCDLRHELLGFQAGDEVRRSTLLQLAHMGADILPSKKQNL